NRVLAIWGVRHPPPADAQHHGAMPFQQCGKGRFAVAGNEAFQKTLVRQVLRAGGGRDLANKLEHGTWVSARHGPSSPHRRLAHPEYFCCEAARLHFSFGNWEKVTDPTFLQRDRAVGGELRAAAQSSNLA